MSHPTVTFDEQWLSDAIAGDAEALCSLLKHYGPELRRRMAGKIAQKWRTVLEPDDVLQVTFIEAFQDMGRFQPQGPGSFLAWLTHLAENNLRDALKELGRAKRPDPRKRVTSPQGEDSCVTLFNLLGTATSTPSRVAMRHEISRELTAAMGKLPTDYAKVVRMYDLECRPVAEVATAIGRSEGAVYMLRSRAHDRLRELLASASRFMSTSG
jgi:RNA polymerase sigma-70 factor (ECF subfamily)